MFQVGQNDGLCIDEKYNCQVIGYQYMNTVKLAECCKSPQLFDPQIVSDCQSTDDRYYKTRKTTRARERKLDPYGPCQTVCMLNKTNLLDVSQGVPNYTAMYDYFTEIFSNDLNFTDLTDKILSRGLAELNNTIDQYGGIPSDPRTLCYYWGYDILEDIIQATFLYCPNSLISKDQFLDLNHYDDLPYLTFHLKLVKTAPTSSYIVGYVDDSSILIKIPDLHLIRHM